MDYKEFISFYTNDGQKHTYTFMKSLDVFLNQVENCVIEAQKNNGEASYKEIFSSIFTNTSTIHRLFYKETSKGKDISSTKFYQVRTIIIDFVKWLKDNDLLDNIDSIITYLSNLNYEKIVDKDNFIVSYFRNLESVINFIDDTGREAFRNSKSLKKNALPYDKTDDLLKEKCIAILGWYGFSFVDMTNIKKSDIITNNGKTYILSGNDKVFLSKTEADIIKRYSMSTSFRSITSATTTGKIIYVIDTDYLMRGKLETEDGKQTPNSLTTTIKVFNTKAAKLGSIHALNILSLYRSNLYSKVYNFAKESNNISITQLLATIGVTDSSEQTKHRVRYKNWVDTFYPTN